jgi:hypothetical protein
MKVTKWSIFNGELTVSNQKAEQTSGESGSLSAGISQSADMSSESATASVAETSAAASEPAASEAPKAEAPKVEAVKAEASAQVPQPEASTDKISHAPGKVIVMSRGDRAWSDQGIHAEPEAAGDPIMFGKRRIAAIAAVVALAVAAGALGGAFATATFMHGSSDVAMNVSQTSLEASLSRIDADIQALKTGLDHTSKLGMNQFNKTSDRLDKLERAQAEPAARIAKLSEAVDKLRAAPSAVPVAATAAPAAAPSASKDTTGSIASTPAQQAAAAPGAPKIEAKTEVGRLPTLDDWVLRDVAYGGALIYGRRGTYEVYAGDMIPGLGRVDAIRRQDGRWVVVTSKGLIVAR